MSRMLFIPLVLVLALGGGTVPAALAEETPEAAAAAASDAYAVKPGDVIMVSVWKEPDLQAEVLIRPDGGFSFPLTGEVSATGKSVAQIQAEIERKIEKYIPDPVVTVSLRQIQGNKIYVLGKVNRPGPFIMTDAVDVMQALSLAGGTSTFADLDDIKVLRRDGGSQQAIPFHYGEVERGRNLEQNIVLQSGDVVVVP